MLEIGAFEAKNTLGALLDRVEHGEEVLITRHGRPVALIVPSAGRFDRNQASEAMKRIRQRAHKLKSTSFDWPSLKAERDASRP